MLAPSSKLEPWIGPPLVSAGGTPLTVHGHACMTLQLGGRDFLTDMVVVSPLTSEAILGVDFLQAQQALIDLAQGTMKLQWTGWDILLSAPPVSQPFLDTQPICMTSTVKVPPRTVMAVPAQFETPVQGVWLVEEAPVKYLHFAVGRAIVEPSSTRTLVCVVNISDEPVTLYAGSVIVTLQPVEVPVGVSAMNQEGEPDIDDEKKQMLWQLVEGCSPGLSASKRDTFYNLLLKHADVMASSTADFRRTNKVQHHIDTGDAMPIRQPV